MNTGIDRARRSLEGLSVGDSFGQLFFSYSPQTRRLPPGPWPWTDDTHMALSVVEVLGEHGAIDQDALAQAFAGRFAAESWRGYGRGAMALLDEIYQGEDWRRAAADLFDGGSYGNGGAMRAAPIGGFFAGDLERAADQGRLAAAVTHGHPEGQAGAMAVAVAAALAAAPDPPEGDAFLGLAAEHVPPGPTRTRIDAARRIGADELQRAADELGTGQLISAQDTVPFCLWSAAHHLRDFEEAMWWTVSGRGDRDTTCAIVGGIVALSCPETPADWVASREPLPPGF